MENIDHVNRKGKDSHQQAEERPVPPTLSPERLSPAEEVDFREQEKYRLLAESAPLGIAVIGSTGRYKYLNPKFVDIFGYTLDDIPTGREWFAKAFPDAAYLDQVMAEWKLYRQESQTGEGEPRNFTVICKDGAAKVIKFRAVPLEGGEQFILYEDITELQQAEEARRETEELLKLLMESAGDAFFLHDHGKIIEVNKQACDSLGYSREELLGMAIQDLEVKIRPEDLATLWGENLFHPCTILGVGRRKDGSTFPVEVRDNNFNYRGRKLRISLVRDVTDRLRAERALKESELKYRTLVEQIPAITYTSNLDHSTTTYVSPQVESILGFSPADYKADQDLWLKRLHPEDRDRVLAEVARCHETGEPFAGEYRMVARNGKLVWFRDEARLVQDPSGRQLFLQGVMLDISERKLAEEKLLRAKEEWERTFDAIPDLIMILDDQYRIVRANRAMAQRFGYHPEEMVGELCYRALYGLESPHSPCRYKLLLDTGQTKQIEMWDEKLQGYFLLTLSPIYDPSGKIVGSVQMGTDITERKLAEEALKKSEERYRVLAENVSDVIWTTDMDLRATYISPSIQHVLGFAPEEILDTNVGEFLPPASLARVREVFREELAREKNGLSDPKRYRVLELEEVHKNGTHIQTEVKASFIRDAHNQPIGILGVTRDITERKAAEEALQRREAVLEAVSYAAEKFLKTHSWEKDIQEVLARLGQAVQVSRIHIFENHPDQDGPLSGSLRYEWVAPNVAGHLDNPKFQGASYRAAGLARWEEVLSQGRIILGPLAQFPLSEQAFLAAVGIKSILVVPIFVGQQWWGSISFADGFQAREWSSTEIDALLTAASIFGLTILHHAEKAALRDSEEKLRFLSNKLLTTQEEERRLLASELHNVLGHDLLLLKLKLESLQSDLSPEHAPQKKEVSQVISILQGLVRNLRGIYKDLSPGDLEDLGPTVALRLLVQNFAEVMKIQGQIDIDPLDNLLGLPVQTAIYRTVLEALTNIGKHAKAKRVTFRAKKDEQGISFTIEDDGKGFNIPADLKARRTLGLLAMEERVKILHGSFEISSRENKGTKIFFRIPFPSGRKAN